MPTGMVSMVTATEVVTDESRGRAIAVLYLVAPDAGGCQGRGLSATHSLAASDGVRWC